MPDPQTHNDDVRLIDGNAIYRIEFNGDGANVDYAETWDDVVLKVAHDCYHLPTDENIKEVRGMLEEGIDSDGGWDGRRVTLQFEDGTVSVRRYVPAPALSAPTSPEVVNKALLDAATAFVDDDECRLDHHGYCQTHGSTSQPCSMVTLRAAISAATPLGAGDPLPKLPEDEWVSVKDRMPTEDYLEVDVLFGSGDSREGAFMRSLMHGERFVRDGDTFDDYGDPITHWTPKRRPPPPTVAPPAAKEAANG